MSNSGLDVCRNFQPASAQTAQFYSLPALADNGYSGVSRLPVSIRLVLESALRNRDGVQITDDHIEVLARWRPDGARGEIPFKVARVV